MVTRQFEGGSAFGGGLRLEDGRLCAATVHRGFERMRRFGEQASAGAGLLEQAHGIGLIHRDIKNLPIQPPSTCRTAATGTRAHAG